MLSIIKILLTLTLLLISGCGNGSGIAEGRDLKDKSFNLAQIPNRSTND